MADPKLFEESFTIVGHPKDYRATHVRLDRWELKSVAETTGSADPSGGAGLITILIDINKELYPLSQGDQVTVALASTLQLDGSKMEKGWREKGPGEVTLDDQYDYVCSGTVYRFEEGKGDNIEIYVSYGGLLLKMTGPYKKLTPLRVQEIYILMKKTSGGYA